MQQTLDRLPPNALDFEEAVLGAMLLDSSACQDVLGILTPEHFYLNKHGLIFTAIKELNDAKKPIDIITVSAHIRSNPALRDANDPFFISQLTNRMVGAGNIEYYSRIIQQKFIARQLIRISGSAIDEAFRASTDIFDLHSSLTANLDTLVKFVSSGAPQGTEDLNKDFIDKNKVLVTQKGLSGITSGLNDLDRITGGWQNTDLIILAARPGMGKTSLMLKYVISACARGKGVVVFSLEMSRSQLFYRIMSIISGIPLEKFIKTGLNPPEMQRYEAFYKEIIKWNIIIDDTPALSIQDMRLRVKQYRSKMQVDLVLDDYLQLHTSKGSSMMNKNDEVSKISSGLKAIAKEFNVPVIALSQLSRSVETRGGDKRPMLSDLRDSGSIEQDADIVQFLYRPEYYGITNDEAGHSLIGVAEIVIAKHRNGSIDSCNVGFNGQTVAFKDL